MAWHIVEKLIEQVGQHSTLVGKFWTTFFFVLRFLMVVSIADSVFGDEQGAFVCNTQTPGCSNVCYNDFSPISMIRLWALQILSVAIPSIIFIVYTAHKLAKIEQARKLKKAAELKKKKQLKEAKRLREEARVRRRKMDEGPPEYNLIHGENGHITNLEPTNEKAAKEATEKEEKKEDEKKDEEVVATKLAADTPPRLFLAYVTQVIFRLLVEIIFMVIQFNIYVYKFYVPELFKCARYPCPNVVDCFVSRPKEKTIMLWVMFGTGCIMIILNIIELYHLGIRKILEAWKRRGEDITKEYKVSNMPTFGRGAGGYNRYRGGYPQAVGIRVGYARSSISGEGGNDFDGDEFI